MPRTAPEITPPAWRAPTSPETLTYDIRVVTPMFGGGYEPGVVDDVSPIRPASIRGHLRFWWRATAGARYATSETLFNAESAIWGNTEQPGKVVVQVTATDSVTTRPAFTYWRNGQWRNYATPLNGWSAYATFSFQGRGNGHAEGVNIREGTDPFSFSMTLQCPAEILSEVKQSVESWILFGGIGSRTRRGCGSLACDGIFFTAAQPPEQEGVPERLIPMLRGSACAYGAPQVSAIFAWCDAVQKYRDFRQGIHFARDNGPGHPGRSLWPEPDTIRRDVTRGHWEGNHMPEKTPSRGYPRADLGLPIVFHFLHEGPDNDLILEHNQSKRTRFASPIITKAVRTENGQFRPIILVLRSPRAMAQGGLALRSGVTTVATTQPLDTDPAGYGAPVAVPMTAVDATYIREALLRYAISQDYYRGGI